MSLKSRIEQDLKAALLGGEKSKVEVLRGLKSAILYAEVAEKSREKGLSDDQILAVLAKESKKRAESADIYSKAGEAVRANAELSEKNIIDEYLPAPVSDEDLSKIIDETVAGFGSAPQMGQVIGEVRKKAGPSADGAKIAALVKAKLGS